MLRRWWIKSCHTGFILGDFEKILLEGNHFLNLFCLFLFFHNCRINLNFFIQSISGDIILIQILCDQKEDCIAYCTFVIDFGTE